MDMSAIGRYVQIVEVSGTVSERTGGSWRVNCPSGISGPRLRAGRRNSTTLKDRTSAINWALRPGRQSARPGRTGCTAPVPGGPRSGGSHVNIPGGKRARDFRAGQLPFQSRCEVRDPIRRA
ncbi:hypothetical protein TPA0905_53230 [Streptomyces olivaceus]|nr:hypothetical protein TPA0905_53230 [Streptomyces olivaceus]